MSNWEIELDHTRNVIQMWRGGDIALWEYSPSLCRLVVRVTSKSQKGNIHINCLDCRYICGPTNGEQCDLEIIANQVNQTKIDYTLRDNNNNFEVHCGALGVEENIEPIY